MWGLGEVEEIFKTAPREHAAISPTVRTAKGKARKLTRHSCFKWRVDLQGKKKSSTSSTTWNFSFKYFSTSSLCPLATRKATANPLSRKVHQISTPRIPTD